jgi:hypothetical protein
MFKVGDFVKTCVPPADYVVGYITFSIESDLSWFRVKLYREGGDLLWFSENELKSVSEEEAMLWKLENA